MTPAYVKLTKLTNTLAPTLLPPCPRQMCCPRHRSYCSFCPLAAINRAASPCLHSQPRCFTLPQAESNRAKPLELLAKNVLPFNFLLKYFVIAMGNLTQERKEKKNWNWIYAIWPCEVQRSLEKAATKNSTLAAELSWQFWWEPLGPD